MYIHILVNAPRRVYVDEIVPIPTIFSVIRKLIKYFSESIVQLLINIHKTSHEVTYLFQDLFRFGR